MVQIKRYSNRKLYDTEAGQYVTLEDIASFIRRGEEVSVVDHATGRDLTSVTLMQVLFQEEKKIGELLPEVVLTRMIRTGGETIDSLRNRILAAFDPDGQVEEEILRRVQGLVKHGELAAEEAERWIDKLLNYPSRWEVTHTAEAPSSTSTASDENQESTELSELLAQVEQLEKELELLKNNPPS
jgi:polyhydroxyalkanoate synthesis repressor PhaR